MRAGRGVAGVLCVGLVTGFDDGAGPRPGIGDLGSFRPRSLRARDRRRRSPDGGLRGGCWPGDDRLHDSSEAPVTATPPCGIWRCQRIGRTRLVE